MKTSNSKINNLTKYGISEILANKIISKSLSIQALKSLQKESLLEDYNFEEWEVEVIKHNLTRKAIPNKILIELLENSAYTCNICRGNKSDAYIIHHIEHYNISQNNSYENLIVLCPNDHELAHREGESLANKITPRQLRSAKKKWEQHVSEIPVRNAAIEGEIQDVDYVNVNRILELAIQIFDGSLPETKNSRVLREENILLATGQINPSHYEAYSLNKNTPLKFYALHGSTMLIYHYHELLIRCLNMVELFDLDDILNIKSIKGGIVGKFCYYVGGVYGKQYIGEINANSEPTYLHFKRNKIGVKWYVDPMFITSTTASWRISSHCIFIIYGKILNVKTKQDLVEIIIRPYAYGIPTNTKNRTPMISYFKNDLDDLTNDVFHDLSV